MADRLDLHLRIVFEITMVIDNYTILLDRAVMLCPDYETTIAKQLLYTVFKQYMPLILVELDKCRSSLHPLALVEVDTKIMKMRTKHGIRDAGLWTEEDFNSPIVLLLKLAVDKGDISFDQEQDDWGRLWSVRQFLQSLDLKKNKEDDELYWPGLPSCIVSIVPVWTSHQIVISASNDRFFITKALQKRGRAFRTLI